MVVAAAVLGAAGLVAGNPLVANVQALRALVEVRLAPAGVVGGADSLALRRLVHARVVWVAGAAARLALALSLALPLAGALVVLMVPVPAVGAEARGVTTAVVCPAAARAGGVAAVRLA